MRHDDPLRELAVRDVAALNRVIGVTYRNVGYGNHVLRNVDTLSCKHSARNHGWCESNRQCMTAAQEEQGERLCQTQRGAAGILGNHGIGKARLHDLLLQCIR